MVGITISSFIDKSGLDPSTAQEYDINSFKEHKDQLHFNETFLQRFLF
jgi:hypothetical protein